MTPEMQSFKQELAALLAKYNATVGWNCSDGSDMHGISAARMELTIGKEVLKFRHEYSLTAYDLK